MKRTIIIIIVVVFILTTVYFAGKKISQLTAQTFDIDGIEIDKHTLTIGGVHGVLNLVISNFAKKGYTIDNINVELYSLDGNLIAYQTAPMQDEIKINPKTNNIVSIPLYFKSNFIYQMYNQLKDKYSSVNELFDNYKATGHFGTKVIAKGFVMKNGMKLKYTINKEV